MRIITQKLEICNAQHELRTNVYYLDGVLDMDDVTYTANPPLQQLGHYCLLQGDSGDIEAFPGHSYHLHANDGISITKVMEWHSN
jgi:hypothetical protein